MFFSLFIKRAGDFMEKIRVMLEEDNFKFYIIKHLLSFKDLGVLENV